MYGLVAIPSRCFFTRADFRHGEELSDWNDVFVSHLSSPGFAFDMLALVGLMGEVFYRAGAPSRGSMPTAAQWIMLLQVLKAWRYLLPEDRMETETRGKLQGIGKLLMLLVVFAHFVCCILLAVGHIE